MFTFYTNAINPQSPKPALLSLSVNTLIAASAILPNMAQSSVFEMEEIVITAQKREQNLQDVGIAVTAFSGDQIKQLGFTDAVDLVAQTPGLNVARPGAGAVNAFSIRGVTQNDFASVHEAPVSVYVDEAYISQSIVSNVSMFDLERVEVLRGPQGTLFGRNATGGLLHFVTAKPSQEFEAFVEAQVGEQGRRRVEAAIGGGLSDTVSARFSAVYNESDGLIKNRIGKDGQAADDSAVRLQVLFEPRDDLNILLKATHAEDNSDRGNYDHQVAYNGEFLPAPATDFFGYRDPDGGDPHEGAWDFDGFKDAEVDTLTAKVEWNIQGSLTLTAITNYQDIEHAYAEDSDVSPNNIFNYSQSDDVQQWSQEMRLNWEGDRSRTVVGAYYLEIDGDYGQDSQVFHQEDVDWGNLFYGIPEPGGYNLVSTAEQNTETCAVFGQWDYDLTDTLTLAIGGRWTEDKKEYDFAQGWTGADGFFVFFDGATGSEVPYARYEQSTSDGDWSGKIQLDYKPSEDWLWYASVNRGIKSGGFNLPVDASGILDVNAFGQFVPFAQNNSVMSYDGEVLTAYEVGLKSTILDGTTRINATAFYYDYEDYQVYDLQGLTQFVFNANGTIQGAEVEVVTTPLQGLDILLGLSAIDSEVEDLPLSVQADGKSEAVLAPEWAVIGLVRYAWPAFGGTLAVQTDFAWKDDHIFNLSGTSVIREDDYTVVNASVNYTSDDEHFYGSLFVKNVLDKEYRQYAFDVSGDAGFGSTEDVSGVERWVGLTLGFRW